MVGSLYPRSVKGGRSREGQAWVSTLGAWMEGGGVRASTPAAGVGGVQVSTPELRAGTGDGTAQGSCGPRSPTVSLVILRECRHLPSLWGGCVRDRFTPSGAGSPNHRAHPAPPPVCSVLGRRPFTFAFCLSGSRNPGPEAAVRVGACQELGFGTGWARAGIPPQKGA